MKIKVYASSDSGDSTQESRLGLALCGGGITGGLFEIGVLAALNDVLGEQVEDRIASFVGASAGSSVAVPLAQGIPVERVYEGLIAGTDDPFFPVTRRHVMPIEPLWVLHGVRRLLQGFATGVWRWVGQLGRARLLDELYMALGNALPRGLFRLEKYRRFFEDFLVREGMSERFGELARDLYVVANDVDSGRRVVFGVGEFKDIPISTAVAASSAIPILFEPMRIRGRDYFDGGIGRISHADVLAAHGCTHIVIINPIVPVSYDVVRNAELPGHRMSDQGFLWIYNQCFRIMNKVRLHLALAALVAKHSGLHLLLVEPSEDEEVMFLHESMSDESREVIMKYARREARISLGEQRELIERFIRGEAVVGDVSALSHRAG